MGETADGPIFTFSNSAWKGPDAYDHLHQRILNSKSGLGPWPNAVVHRLRVPVPVRVRLVWEKDGVEYVETIALDWGGLHVLVELLDRQHRWPFKGVWPALRRRRPAIAGYLLSPGRKQLDPPSPRRTRP